MWQWDKTEVFKGFIYLTFYWHVRDCKRFFGVIFLSKNYFWKFPQRHTNVTSSNKSFLTWRQNTDNQKVLLKILIFTFSSCLVVLEMSAAVNVCSLSQIMQQIFNTSGISVKESLRRMGESWSSSVNHLSLHLLTLSSSTSALLQTSNFSVSCHVSVFLQCCAARLAPPGKLCWGQTGPGIPLRDSSLRSANKIMILNGKNTQNFSWSMVQQQQFYFSWSIS